MNYRLPLFGALIFGLVFLTGCMRPRHNAYGQATVYTQPAYAQPAYGQAAYGQAAYGQQPTVVVQHAPPPRPHVQVQTYAPAGQVYVQGHHQWNGHSYVWVNGHHVQQRQGYVYAQPRWQQQPQGYVYVQGGWHQPRGQARSNQPRRQVRRQQRRNHRATVRQAPNRSYQQPGRGTVVVH